MRGTEINNDGYGSFVILKDIMDYCLNDDLQAYCTTYVPKKNNCMAQNEYSRKVEQNEMAWFWDGFLHSQCKNYGNRFKHFMVELGYINQVYTQNDVNLIMGAICNFFREQGFISLTAHHFNKNIHHQHLHIIVGCTGIYGNLWDCKTMNALSIAQYIKQTTDISVSIVETD